MRNNIAVVPVVGLNDPALAHLENFRAGTLPVPSDNVHERFVLILLLAITRYKDWLFVFFLFDVGKRLSIAGQAFGLRLPSVSKYLEQRSN
jgi:hypothetical protein